MNKFSGSPDYVTCERLLIEIDRLTADGKGDNEEAEAVRDQMDTSWYRLSIEEADHIGSLSIGLNQSDSR